MTQPTAPERCPTCDRPRAGEDAASHDDGCVCDLCLSVCWRSWGGQCTEVDWPTRALAAEAERSAILALVSPSSDQSLPDAVRELCEQVEELRGRIATVAAEIEHDIAIKRSHDHGRATGGQTCGTGGPLTPAPQSVLRYLDRVVRDLHDDRTRAIADHAAQWAKVAPLIERLRRKCDADDLERAAVCNASQVAAIECAGAILAATEPTP